MGAVGACSNCEDKSVFLTCGGTGALDAVAVVAGDDTAVGKAVVAAPVAVTSQVVLALLLLEEQLHAPGKKGWGKEEEKR